MISKLVYSLNTQDTTYISGIYESSFAHIIAILANKVKNNLLIITKDQTETKKIYTDLKFFSNLYTKNIPINIFPKYNLLPYENKPISRLTQSERMKTLYYLIENNKPQILISSLENILHFIIPKSEFKKSILNLSLNQEFSFEQLQKILSEYGYNFTNKVFLKGDFSIRGDIVDIFLPIYDAPIRIEFFGDLIEDIRQFDTATQKSIKKLTEINIPPLSEIILSEKHINYALNRIKKLKTLYQKKSNTPAYLWNTNIISAEKINFFTDNLKNKTIEGNLINFISLFYKEKNTLLDYLNNFTVIYPDNTIFRTNYENIFTGYRNRFNELIKKNNFVLKPKELIESKENILKKIEKTKKIIHNIIPFHKKEEIRFRIEPLSRYAGNFKKLKTDLTEYNKNGYKIYFISEFDDEIKKIKELMLSNKININEINFINGIITKGFINTNLKELYIQDFEFFEKLRLEHSTGTRKILARQLDSIYDLKIGDYVVHIEKGIGIYHGIKQIKTDNTIRDYCEIEFADKLKLYLPLDRINLLQKYIGDSNTKPKLNKLKSDDFNKIKLKVKKSIITVAKDLLEIYSKREKLKGFRFPSDTEWQKEFEKSFPYVETPDQITALTEIKRDMEADKPMDRLLCGDVGYGKTEIALRAAFKAVMSGKQVALLVPTTILAQQHYLTFSERLMGYPIEVKMLSRLINSKEKKQILKNLENGKIDILIGTHTLLSDNIKFKDIGLVIIDEEQKFGVLHKEKLKILKTIVDVLTMSATPIPRTLYMSLSGIRDISIINTAPEGRSPIETNIEKFSEETIQKAIIKELNRGGQIYFIHNRVKTISPMANFIRKIVPQAKVAVAHGQMAPDELEIIMIDFIEKKIDVLVCTTIIESGIDIPNVQTIIINRADKFGLSQLYQLRGRVGRSDNISFAYLLYPGDKSITELAYKRLSTIYEYTELGSGYKIALRDLEIRGSGNIFGKQQHGDVLSVGLELYSQILKNSIKELKGEKLEQKIEPVMDFNYTGYIPDSFINDTKSKIEIYKKLNQCRSDTDLTELANEVADRFGKNFPTEFKNLLDIYSIKIYLRKINAEYIKIYKKSRYEMIFEISVSKILKHWSTIKKQHFSFKNNKIYLSVEKNNFIKNLKKKLPLLI